ncbi:MAG: SH3 domain-containing protein [Caldilineaceae bacterium]
MTFIQRKSQLSKLIAPLLFALLLTGCQVIHPAQPTETTPPATASDADTNSASNAVDNVRTLLGKQLHIDPTTIEVVSDETVEWSDSCLGLGTLTESCAAVVTPGHKITLRVDGAQYVFHTDQSGYQARLAEAPETGTSEPIMAWTGNVDNGSCTESSISAEGVDFGLCGAPAKIGGKFAADARLAVLTELAGRYASFDTDNEFGHLSFKGTGSDAANLDVQTLLTRWAKMVTMEAAAGESLAGMEYRGPAEMGSPDTAKCAVFRLGTPIEAGLGACDGSMTDKDMGKKTYLDWEQIRDRFAPFVYETTTEKLTFEGMGLIEGEAWQRAILAWARARHAELASGRTSATISTAASWYLGQDMSQKNVCWHLTVLDYGYAYADKIMCEGGDLIETTGDWLTTEELQKLDLWLYQRTALYLDQNYIAGQGSQEMSEAEQVDAGLWAMDLYARIAGVPSGEIPQADLGRCPAESTTDKRVIDTAHRFCLLIPASHTLFKPNPNEVVIAKDTLLNTIDPRLSIVVTDAAGRSTEQVANEVVAQNAGFEIQRGTVNVAGVDAAMLDNMPGQDINRRVLFVHNGLFYDLTYSPLQEEAAMRPALELFYQSTLNSWHFLDETVATPTPEPSTIPISPTDVAFIQALVNVNIRSGPGTNYERLGHIVAGQTAKVTGVTADNGWWRVICPDDSEGNCFVVNDPQLVQPAPAPTEGAPSIQATTVPTVTTSVVYEDAGGFAFNYPSDWNITGGEAGVRGNIIQFTAPDGTKLDVSILDWDPKNDLNAYVATRKTAWDASGMQIIDEQAWTVGNDHPAVRLIIRSGNEDGFFLLTTLGDQYLTLGGSGNLDALNAIGKSLRVGK